MSVMAAVFLLTGAVFLFVSCVGLLRLPDFYTRAHAVGKAETLGSMLILIGLALYNGAVTNPTATHALTRAAIRSGLKIWRAEGKQSTHDLAD